MKNAIALITTALALLALESSPAAAYNGAAGDEPAMVVGSTAFEKSSSSIRPTVIITLPDVAAKAIGTRRG